MSAAKFGYEGDEETPAKASIAVADAYTNDAGLPTYSELVEALRDAEHRLNELIATGDFEPEDLRCIRRACALLSRIPS